MGKARVDLRSVTTVGLDLAKHVFQIHAVDADGKIVIATALRRRDGDDAQSLPAVNLIILATVRGSIPNRRAAAR